MSFCFCVAAAASALAQAPPADERIERLEKLLAETRAEVAALKAASTGGEIDARLAEIDRKIEILAAEIEAMKLGDTAPAAPAAIAAAPAGAVRSTPQDTAQRYGLGLSAAKVYGLRRGVSIGGYGEALYENFAEKSQDGSLSDNDDRIDFLRAVLYLGYKFDDHWVLNTEIEYEHAVAAADSGGEVAVEFAYVDYMHSAALNGRAGLVLVPMGLINELHEPTAFLGARRPDVERLILPTTWRELGGGVYGNTGPLSYRGYVTSSLDSESSAPRDPLRPPGRGRGQGAGLGADRTAGLHGRAGPPGRRLGFQRRHRPGAPHARGRRARRAHDRVGRARGLALERPAAPRALRRLERSARPPRSMR